MNHFSAIACAALVAFSADAIADQQIDAIVDPIIEKEIAAGTPGAAFIFVRDGKVVYQRGYGVSDVASAKKVDPEQTVWPIASVTKAITAMAALQLVANGRVKLDDDLNRHLKRLQVPAHGYSPLTLRHVLSHTGALDEIPGRRYDGKQAPDMAAFLKDKLVRYREPGKLTAYSTYGMALAGVLIEDVSGQPYADYLTQHIFKPAGMSSARVMTHQGDEKGVATPYEIDDGRANAVPYEWYVTPPTSSMAATAADMGRLLLVHLADGRAGNSEFLSSQLVRAMHEQQATNHPDLPGWSLGFQLDEMNGVSIVRDDGKRLLGFARDEQNKIVSVTGGSWRVADRLP